MKKKNKEYQILNLIEAKEKQENETFMDIILRPLVVINLDDDDIAKIDDKVCNESNTLFTSSISLVDDYSTKSIKIGENHSISLDVIPLASFPPSTWYTKQDWEADEFLVGLFSCAILVLPLVSIFL
jgi:hypothetical protein